MQRPHFSAFDDPDFFAECQFLDYWKNGDSKWCHFLFNCHYPSFVLTDTWNSRGKKSPEAEEEETCDELFVKSDFHPLANDENVFVVCGKPWFMGDAMTQSGLDISPWAERGFSKVLELLAKISVEFDIRVVVGKPDKHNLCPIKIVGADVPLLSECLSQLRQGQTVAEILEQL